MARTRANGGGRRKNCVELSEKRTNQASKVNRFFKLMFGKDHTEVMYLPPKFARTVTSLVDQKISITNLDGHDQHWEVTISRNYDRSLVFKEGWPTFFSENNIRTGDLLIFQHLSGRHFEVEFFDRKTACHRTNIATQKRTRTHKRSKKSPEIVPVQATDVINIEDDPRLTNALKLRSKPQNIPKTLVTHPNAPVINLEDDIICMVNRDVDYGQGGSRNITFDLSTFELKNHKSNCDNIEQTAPVPLVHVEQRETNQPASSHLSDKVENFDDLFLYYGLNKPFDDANSNNAMPDDVCKPSTGGVTGFLPSSYVSTSTSSISSNIAKRENAFMANPFDEYSLRSTFPIPNTVKDTAFVKKELMESRDKFDGFAHMPSRGSEGFLAPEPTRPSIGSNSQVAKQKNAFMSGLQDTLTQSSSPLPNFGTFRHDVKRDNTFMSKPFGSSLPSSFPNSSVEQVVRVKKELLDSRERDVGIGQVSHGKFPNMMNFGQTSSPIVKTEPGMLNYDAVPFVAPSTFSVEVKSQSYLELPVGTSLSKVPGEEKVITLADSAKRLWPVIYTDLYVTKVFTGNWKSFCDANGVEPGDTCEFQPHNDSFCDFGVIVHKFHSTS